MTSCLQRSAESPVAVERLLPTPSVASSESEVGSAACRARYSGLWKAEAAARTTFQLPSRALSGCRQASGRTQNGREHEWPFRDRSEPWEPASFEHFFWVQHLPVRK